MCFIDENVYRDSLCFIKFLFEIGGGCIEVVDNDYNNNDTKL